jgi:hypothetical protein
MEINISELAIDETLNQLYPRSHFDYRKVIEYASAMKTGAKFPKILVGIHKGLKYVPDGIHRVKASQLLKKDSIDAEVKEYDSFTNMYVDAVKLNSTHGLGLKFSERAVIMRRMLEEFKIPKRQISEILGVPIPQFTVFLERTFINSEGKIESFKASVWKAMKEQEFDETEIQQVGETINQDIVTSTRIQSLLKELLQALENNLIPFNVPEIKELASEILVKLNGALTEND